MNSFSFPSVLFLLLSLLIQFSAIDAAFTLSSALSPSIQPRQAIFRWFDSNQKLHYYSATNFSPIFDNNNTNFTFQEVAFYVISNESNPINVSSGNITSANLIPLYQMKLNNNNNNASTSIIISYQLVVGDDEVAKLKAVDNNNNNTWSQDQLLGYVFTSTKLPLLEDITPSVTRLYSYYNNYDVFGISRINYFYSAFYNAGITSLYNLESATNSSINRNKILVFSSPQEYYLPFENNNVPKYAQYRGSTTRRSWATTVALDSSQQPQSVDCSITNNNVVTSLEIENGQRTGTIDVHPGYLDIWTYSAVIPPTVSWTVDVKNSLNVAFVNNNKTASSSSTNSSSPIPNNESDVDFYFAVQYSTYVDPYYYPSPIFNFKVADAKNPLNSLNQPNGTLYFRPPDTTSSNSYPVPRMYTIGEKFPNLHRFVSNVDNTSSSIKITLILNTLNAYWGMFLYRVYVIAVPSDNNNNNNTSNGSVPIICPALRRPTSYSGCGKRARLKSENASLGGSMYAASYAMSVQSDSASRAISQNVVDLFGLAPYAFWTLPSNWKEEVESSITVEFCKDGGATASYFYASSNYTFVRFSFSTIDSSSFYNSTVNNSTEYLDHFDWSNIPISGYSQSTSTIICANYTLPRTFKLRKNSIINISGITPSWSSVLRYFLITKIKISSSPKNNNTTNNNKTDESCLNDPGFDDPSSSAVVTAPPSWSFTPSPLPLPRPSPATTYSPSNSQNSAASSATSNAMKPAVVAGASVGGVIGLVLVVAFVFWLAKRREAHEGEEEEARRRRHATLPTTDDGTAVSVEGTIAVGDEATTARVGGVGGDFASVAMAEREMGIADSLAPRHLHFPLEARDYDPDMMNRILSRAAGESSTVQQQEQEQVFVMSAPRAFGGELAANSPSEGSGGEALQEPISIEVASAAAESGAIATSGESSKSPS